MWGSYLRRIAGTRLVWFALAAAALILALPTGTSAHPTASSQSTQLITRTVKTNDGFKFSLTASPEPHAPPSLNVALSKSPEFDNYEFAKHITFTSSSDLGSAKLKGTLAQKRGSVDMTFTATTSRHVVPVPTGCKGTAGAQRRGVLKGSFHFKADKLGTIKLKSIGAKLEQPPNITSCKGGKPSHGTQLDASDKGKTHFDVSAFKPARRGPVFDVFMVTVAGPRNSEGIPAYVFSYLHIVITPRSDYTFSKNLSKATLKGAHGIGGSASYKGTPASIDHASKGKLSGEMSITFAAIGRVNLFAHGSLKATQFSS